MPRVPAPVTKPREASDALPPVGIVQMGSRTEEGQPRLVHSGGSDGLVITDDELLRAGWRHRGEAWHVCAAVGQGAVHRRVVKVIIEGPVARLLAVKVDPLSDFVVSNRVLLTIVRECAVGGYVGPGMYGRIPIAAGDHAAWGITPPGNTQCAVELQPAKLYGSPLVTVYPNRCESIVGQSSRARHGGRSAGTGTAIDGAGQKCRIKISLEVGQSSARERR